MRNEETTPRGHGYFCSLSIFLKILWCWIQAFIIQLLKERRLSCIVPFCSFRSNPPPLKLSDLCEWAFICHPILCNLALGDAPFYSRMLLCCPPAPITFVTCDGNLHDGHPCGLALLSRKQKAIHYLPYRWFFRAGPKFCCKNSSSFSWVQPS